MGPALRDVLPAWPLAHVLWAPSRRARACGLGTATASSLRATEVEWAWCAPSPLSVTGGGTGVPPVGFRATMEACRSQHGRSGGRARNAGLPRAATDPGIVIGIFRRPFWRWWTIPGHRVGAERRSRPPSDVQRPDGLGPSRPPSRVSRRAAANWRTWLTKSRHGRNHPEVAFLYERGKASRRLSEAERC